MTGISPRSGPAAGFTVVRIRGDNLGENREDLVGLTIGAVDCLDTVTHVSPRLVRCKTKEGRGIGAIVVTTKSGGVGSSCVHYHYDNELVMRQDSIEVEDVPGVGRST